MSIPRVQVADPRDTVQVEEVAVDRVPVTNARYAVFVRATGHRAPAYWPDGECPHSIDNHPVVGVDYFDAIAFARWAKGRLPTELEWVLASGVEEQRAYAWGDDFDNARCNTHRSGHKATTPVHAYPNGAAPSGCLDLCGNVWEMTASADKDHPHTIIVKGGSWYDYPAHAKLDANFHAPTHRVGRTVGFRLVYGGEERHPEFMDADLLEACIDYRARPQQHETDAPIEEFDFGALRDELELEHGVGLLNITQQDEGVAVPGDDVDTALVWFDLAEQSIPATSTNDNANDKEQALDVALEWYMRMHAFIAARPGILFAAVGAAVLLVATTLWASVHEPDSSRPATLSHRDGPEQGSAPRYAAATPSRPPAHPTSKRSATRKAVENLSRGKSNEQSLALRILLARGESSRAEIEQALARETDPDAELRLHYALAALDERKNGAGRTVPVTVLPTRGLVLACARFGSAERRCLEELRRLGRASKRDVHVVISGTREFGAWLETNLKDLGGVFVAWDPERNFARQHKLRADTAVVGLRSDGRAAFVLPGAPSRTRMFDQLRAMR